MTDQEIPEFDAVYIIHELEKCKADPVYFYERYCGIKQHSGIIEYPKLPDYKKELLRKLIRNESSNT